jgi:hypothetical protein
MDRMPADVDSLRHGKPFTYTGSRIRESCGRRYPLGPSIVGVLWISRTMCVFLLRRIREGRKGSRVQVRKVHIPFERGEPERGGDL